MTESATAREAKPFADIPVSDYIRDAAGALLLLMSLSLPWDVTHRAADRVGVVLATLLALMVLALPYAARIGILPSTWTVRSTRTTRLVASVPYVTVVLLAIIVDLTTAGAGPGLGTAAALGLAGVAITAQPRACELGPEDQDLAGKRWTKALMILGIVSAVIVALGLVSVAVAGAGALGVVSTAVIAVWLVVLIGWPILGTIRGDEASRLTLIGLGIAIVVAAVLGSGELQLPHLVTFSTPAPVILLIPLAGAIAASAAVARGTATTTAIERWVAVAVRVLDLLAITAGAIIAWAVLGLAEGPIAAGEIISLILGVLVLAAALTGRRSLASNSVQGRLPALAGAGLSIVVGTVLLVSDGGGFSMASGTARFLIAFGLPGLAIIALTVPREVRGFFNENHPTSNTAAYRWQSSPERASTSSAADADVSGETDVVARPTSKASGTTNAEARITPVEPERSGYAARPGLSATHQPAAESQQPQQQRPSQSAQPSEASTQVISSSSHDAGETQVMAPVAGFTVDEASNPSTPLETLARIAAEVPDLRPAIAENPSTYPALLDWLDRLGDSDVDAALARRARRS